MTDQPMTPREAADVADAHRAQSGNADLTRGERALYVLADTFRATSPAPEGGDGASLIAAERRRQVEAEGWTPEHDVQHQSGQLVAAAAVYLREISRNEWPWRNTPPKLDDNDRVRELVKAGALIAAEIDRLAGTSLAPAPEGGDLAPSREWLLSVVSGALMAHTKKLAVADQAASDVLDDLASSSLAVVYRTEPSPSVATPSAEGEEKPGAWITEEFKRARERMATVPPHARPMWTRGSFGDRGRFDASAAPLAEGEEAMLCPPCAARAGGDGASAGDPTKTYRCPQCGDRWWESAPAIPAQGEADPRVDVLARRLCVEIEGGREEARAMLARLDALRDAAPAVEGMSGEEAARLRGRIYAALTASDVKPIRLMIGRRWLDAPEAEEIADVAVAALRGVTS